MRLRVLTWNLFHGRSVPGSGRDLFDEFRDALDDLPWDVVLLQEVPPWWPPRLAQALGCEQRMVLTSRNELPALRRAIAVRFPDVIKSGGGGANAILVRADRIVDAHSRRLCRRPERRWVHGVQLACGVWVSNLHATAHDTAAAQHDLAAALRATREWAREARAPFVLGGDFNLRTIAADGVRTVADSDVDHIILGERIAPTGPATVLPHGHLSDHAPLAVTVELEVS